MVKESMLTNFAIWLQDTHGEEIRYDRVSDIRLRELANEWLTWFGEVTSLTFAEKVNKFPGYDEKTETCYYCFEHVCSPNCNSWHCHNCGSYSLNTKKVCSNCNLAKLEINLTSNL